MKPVFPVVVIVLASGAAAPANAQTPLAPSALAYTQINFGEQWTPFGSVVTPHNTTGGPYTSAPTWSPDGKRVAYLSAADIMVMDATGGNIQNITNTGSAELGVAWSPDGRKIAFASDRDGAPELYLMNPDGSGVVRVTTEVGLVTGFLSFRPTWSSDNTRLAFTCRIEAGNDDICMIRSDGTGFLRLTHGPARDSGPAWSPDGRSILFTRSPFDGPGGIYYETNHQLMIMSADGTNVSPLGIVGWDPTWSPDGSQIAFAGYGFEWTAVYVMNVDGSGVRWLGDYAEEPAWMPGPALLPYIDVQCNGLVCRFDASESIGAISSYSWDFGDGTTASGAAVSHSYADGGNIPVVLSLSGENGLAATRRHEIILNMLPVAAFTVSCESLRCVFDWSGSYDPDGHGVNVSWDFGDGTWSCEPVQGAPKQCAHTYAAAGPYTTTLRVYDSYGAARTTSQTLTIVAPSMHVGDLDGTSTQQASTWTATVAITVHDSDHRPVTNAVVSASWNDGAAVSCTTDTTGRCLFSKSRIAKKATASITVRKAVDGKHSYTPAGNHDPDGDSDGTTIRFGKLSGR